MSVKDDKRIVVFIGHFGSGKSEISVNYALKIKNETKAKTAIIDLDIANPFFRSREKKEEMEALGIENLSNMYGKTITDEIPALDPAIRRPLENKEYRAVVDAGGDPSGAKLLVQFQRLLMNGDCDVFAVVNANRPETRNLKKSVEMLQSIEYACGLKITGIVNNTHMIRETTVADIIRGYSLAKQISEQMQIPIKYSTCEKHLLPELMTYVEKNPMDCEIFPISLELRDSWLDKKV